MTETLIGFAGRKYSGKDTAASALEGFENVKMAGALKAMLGALLTYQGASEQTVQRMLEGDLKETPSPLLGGRTMRHAMQTLGTEWGRDLMSENLWIGVAEYRISLFEKVCVSDVRFQNEVDMVRRLGGWVYWIKRPGYNDTDTHSSETQLDDIEVDDVIENDSPSAEAFAERISDYLLD